MATILYETDILKLSPKKAQIIAQQCNCTSRKARGLAKDIIDTFPYADFYSKRTKSSKPGTIKVVGSPKTGKRLILAMFSQLQPGNSGEGDTSSLRETWFGRCLEKISSNIKGLRSIAFPYKIGCGMAGGNWENYKAMIDRWAKKNPQIEVYIASLESTLPTPQDSPLTPAFYQWVWQKIQADPWIDSDRLREEWLSQNPPLEDVSEIPDEPPKDTPSDPPKGSRKDLSQSDSRRDQETGSHMPPDDIPTHQNTTFVEFVKGYTPEGWDEFFQFLEENEYLDELSKKLSERVKAGETIYPPLEDTLSAFEYCPPKDMKVVIIGQDPYHTPGAAMGLAFSTPEGAKLQPSLRTIFKELESDGFKASWMDKNKRRWVDGDLTYWANQGVFLINTALTVRKGDAYSHGEEMWSDFTGQLFRYLNDNCEHLVVVMWGVKARAYAKYFSQNKHCHITGGHPSPLNSKGDFRGTKPFSRTNLQLEKWGREPIDWNLIE